MAVFHRKSLWEGSSSNYQQPQQTNEKPQRTCIKELVPHFHNTVVVGLVISKLGTRSFPDKKNPGNTRWKLTLTIRDSPSDYINVTCWGSEDYIMELNSAFKILDVVEIGNPNIQTKTTIDEKWTPTTTSPLQLTLNEKYSTLSLYAGWDADTLQGLSHIPIRSMDEYATLLNLQNTPTNSTMLVNILAVVKSVGPTKTLNSKSGKLLERCEVKLFDETWQTFSLFIWDKDVIELAKTWQPKNSVLFIVDVQVKFDEFRQSIVATFGPKTIVITNPDCPEGHRLYQYAQKTDIGSDDFETQAETQLSDVSKISDVFTTVQIKQHSSNKPEYAQSFSYTGICYGAIESLDVHSDDWRRCISLKCSSCKTRISNDQSVCQNPNCTAYGTDQSNGNMTFDLRMCIADQTGSISSVRLSDKPAEEFLKCTPETFATMSISERISLRTNRILERWKIYFKALYNQQSTGYHYPQLRVLSIAHFDFDDINKI